MLSYLFTEVADEEETEPAPQQGPREPAPQQGPRRRRPGALATRQQLQGLRTSPPEQWGTSLPSDDGEITEVLTSVHPDVFGACLMLTARGLHDRRMGVLAMAWLWVLVTLGLEVLIIWSVHSYIYRQTSTPFSSRDGLGHIVVRLKEHLLNNTTPNTTHGSREDRAILEICKAQPSVEFFLAVQFIWSARMLAQLSASRGLFYALYHCPVVDTRAETVEEVDDRILLKGLLPSDCLLFTMVLVVPKALMALFLWYVGTEFLAVTRDFGYLLFKAVTMYYISILESEVFNSFLSASKREWICQAQILQLRGPLAQLSVSWPGEVLKLLSAAVLVAVSQWLFPTELAVRNLCFNCVHACNMKCSVAFSYCKQLDAWPYNYNEKHPYGWRGLFIG